MDEIRKELTGVWRKFGRMMDSGIPVVSALKVIGEETLDPRLKEAIRAIAVDIQGGATLSNSMAKHPALFSKSVRTLVQAGEMTGAIDRIAKEIAEGLQDGTFDVGEVSVAIGAGASEKAPGAPAEVADTTAFAPVIKLVSRMIVTAMSLRASDIHIDWVGRQLRVRYRVDGVLQASDEPIPSDLQEQVISRIKIMANLNLQEKRRSQDGRILVNVQGKDLDMRVCVAPCVTGESVTVRLLHRSTALAGLDAQGFTPDNLERLRRWSRLPNGIIVVTGPTGCGKTTTLYSVLQSVNTPAVKIVTAEDPVEYIIDGIDQQPVNVAAGMTFPAIMRSQMRQDPDIIMVGEIRDLDTAHIAIQASLTGHLVLTTLHTMNAAGAVRRLLDMGIEPFLVQSTLSGVLAQRLVRIICPDCREEGKAPEWIAESLRDHPGLRCFKGKGCEKCNRTGYRGRVAIHEMLEVDEKMKRLIGQDADAAAIHRQAVESGMIPMREDGLTKADQGVTTIEEVLRVCAGC